MKNIIIRTLKNILQYDSAIFLIIVLILIIAIIYYKFKNK